MDEPSGKGMATDVTSQPRRYFDGNEQRYDKAEQQALAGESTILQWKAYLEYLVWILLAICVVLFTLTLVFGSRPQFKVEFIVRNDHGEFRTLTWDEYNPETGEIKKTIEEWLLCARSITTDRVTHQRCWRRVPMFVREKSQCAKVVDAYQRQRQPGAQLYHKSVVVEDLQGSQEPDSRWRFSWVEKTYQLDHGHVGPLIDTSTWHAILIFQRRPPTKESEIKDGKETVNPLGLLCSELAWWK